MTNLEREILESLTQLQQAVAAMAAAHPKPSLLPLFTQLDDLASQLPPNSDPSLRHYLQKKSYDKARLFLLGRETENLPGPCGHRD
jgi:hypothetical protein